MSDPVDSVSLAEAARRIGRSEEEVEQLIRAGRIRMTRDAFGTPRAVLPLPSRRAAARAIVSPRAAVLPGRWRDRWAIRAGFYGVAAVIAIVFHTDFLLALAMVTIFVAIGHGMAHLLGQ